MALMVTVSPENFAAVRDVLAKGGNSLITATIDNADGKKLIICPASSPMLALDAMGAGAASACSFSESLVKQLQG